jgi:hypothetical protein
MKHKQNFDRKPDAASYKAEMRAAYEKIAFDAESQLQDQMHNSEFASDLFLGLLVIRIFEESSDWKKPVGEIQELWSNYAGNNKRTGFHHLISKLASKFKTTDESVYQLNLLKRFAGAVEHLNLGDATWSYLVENFLYMSRFDWKDSVENDGPIGPAALAWANEYVSQWSNQKSSGVYYTSKEEARLVAQLALGYWIDGQLPGYGSLLPGLLIGDPTHLSVIDQPSLLRLNKSLLNIKVIDPACGSGTLLVEMFGLLRSVIETITKRLGRPLNKKKIGLSLIERSLFGYDTDSRALAIAEARLWFCLNDTPKGIAEIPINANLPERDCLIEDAAATKKNQANSGTTINDFDIVIGNPPFVRHESITAPGIERELYTRKLHESVDKDLIGASINRRADLHTFFFYRGISMLKSGGILCYISPNAWLDIEYGEQLRAFLLRRSNLRLLLNPAQRRFAAGVNTLITVASAADARQHDQQGPVKFFTPGHQLTEPDFLSAIFTAVRGNQKDCRIVSKDALRHPKAEINDRRMLAADQRWSTYFRAPDIYFDLIRKLQNRLKPLGDIGHVRYPLKTGINEFFFLTYEQAVERSIEQEYLVPVVKSTKEFAGIALGTTSKTFLFCCDRSLAELRSLKHSGAMKYINWGSRQSTARGVLWPSVPSLKGRNPWYAIPRLDPAHILCNRFFDRRFFFGYSTRPVIEDQTFYGLTLHGGKNVRLLQTALLNSTLSYLFVELFGRISLGEGVLQYAKYEMDSLPALDARDMSAGDAREILDAFVPLTKRPIRPIFEETLQDDRKQFDLVISRKIGLTKSDVKQISSSLVDLVSVRLDKAASSPSKHRRLN